MRKAFFAAVIACMTLTGVCGGTAKAASNAVQIALVITVPEPSSPALLGVDLASVGLLLFIFRRRITR